MAGALNVDSASVQLTLSFFLISYGVSQLFIGSLLDSFGRYKACLIALLVFCAASFIIASTNNIYLIYLMRVIHGFTGGTIVVAKRAYFVDVYTGSKLKHYLSLLSIIWSLGPIIAPFMGGYLQRSFGWRSNFYFLGGLSLILTILEYAFNNETLIKATRFNIRNILSIYKQILTTAPFVLGIVMLGLAYSTVMVYNMTGPFIIEHTFDLSPVVTGYCSLILGFSWMLGGFIGKATIDRPFYKRLTVNGMLQLVFIICMITSIAFVQNIYSLVLFAFIIHAGTAYTFNTYFTFCLQSFPQNAGIAGGLTGGLTYVIVSILSYGVVNMIPAHDEHNLSYSYLLCTLISVSVLFIASRLKTKAL